MAEEKKDWAGFLDDVASPLDKAHMVVTGGPGTDGKWTGYLDDVSVPKVLERGRDKAPAVPQYEGSLRLPAQALHQFYTGVHSVLGFPGAIEKFGTSVLPSVLTKPFNKFGTDDNSPAQQLFPTPQDIAKYSGFGMENRPDLEPQNATEGYLGAAARAVPNALTLAGAGIKAIPSLFISESGELAAETAHQQFPENKWLPVVASVATTLGAGGLVGNVERAMAASAGTKRLDLAQRELDAAHDAVVAGRNPDLKQKADGSKVESATNALAIARDTSIEAKKAARDAQLRVERASLEKLDAVRLTAADTVSSIKQEANTITSAADKAVVETFAGTANTLGKATRLEDAGKTLQEHARNWLEKVFPVKMKAVSDPLDKAVAGTTPTSVSNFEGTLKSINKSAGSLQGVAEEMTDSLPKVLAKRLEARAKLMEATGGSVTPSWDEVREIRTIMGDAMSNPSTMKGISPDNIRKLYAALTQDLNKAAKSVNAGDLFKKYNEEATRLYNFADNTLSKVITSKNGALETIKPEDAADALLRAGKKGPTDLAQLRQELPEATDDLASFQLRQGGNAWNELDSVSQVALVGDKAVPLNQTLAARAETIAKAEGMTTQAETNAKTAFEAAKKEHAETVQAAKDDFRSGGNDRTKALREAQKAKADAASKRAKEQAKLDEKTNKDRYARDVRVVEARKKVKEAESALPPKDTPVENLAHKVSRYVGAGGMAAIAHQLGLATDNPLLGAALAAGGWTLPTIAREGKKLTRTKGARMLVPTGIAAGTATTQNPLELPEQRK